jgi:hypothetical protein
MSSFTSAILYSKYSINSVNLVNTIKNSNIDISMICIDNEKIRKRIMNSKNITVTEVPCILNIYQDGSIEKYEGETCFEYVDSMISQLNQSAQSTQQNQQLSQQYQQQSQNDQSNQSNQSNQDSKVSQSDDVSSDESVVSVKKHKSKSRKHKSKKTSKKTVVSIDSENESDNVDNQASENNGEEINILPENNSGMNVVKKQNTKLQDTLSLADKMLKEREAMNSHLKNPRAISMGQ